MTDLEEFLALMTKFGVEPKVEDVLCGDGESRRVVQCKRGDKKIEGYEGFCVDFLFSLPDEKFFCIDITE